MTEFLTGIMPNVMDRLPDFYQAIGDTLIMVGWSGSIAFVLGLFLGIVLTVTKPGGILEQNVVYQVLDKLVNFFRSLPFIILLTWVIPLSRAIMGTAINVPGAIVPLIMGTVPFFSRQVEGALDELDHGLIEAVLSMGSPWKLSSGCTCGRASPPSRGAPPSPPSAWWVSPLWPAPSVPAAWATSPSSMAMTAT